MIPQVPMPARPMPPPVAVPQAAHPLTRGKLMAAQLPFTPHTMPTHQLMHNAIPIYHQINALKKALGTPNVNPKSSPNGIKGY